MITTWVSKILLPFPLVITEKYRKIVLGKNIIKKAEVSFNTWYNNTWLKYICACNCASNSILDIPGV